MTRPVNVYALKLVSTVRYSTPYYSCSPCTHTNPQTYYYTGTSTLRSRSKQEQAARTSRSEVTPPERHRHYPLSIMPGATALSQQSPASSKRDSRSAAKIKAREDLFSCIGAGDVTTAGALLDAKGKGEKVQLLAATNPSGITLLMHACHTGQAEGISMLLEKVRVIFGGLLRNSCLTSGPDQ